MTSHLPDSQRKSLSYTYTFQVYAAERVEILIFSFSLVVRNRTEVRSLGHVAHVGIP